VIMRVVELSPAAFAWCKDAAMCRALLSDAPVPPIPDLPVNPRSRDCFEVDSLTKLRDLAAAREAGIV
jgi:hypothetical protein